MDKEKLIFLFDQSDIKLRLQDPNQQRVEQEMRQRLIKAKELGRVTPGETPDFIGNFDYGYPRGVFEMYIEERDGNNISGIIEDCYGTATFKGVLSDREISFIKHYLPERSSVFASKSDFNYNGECLPSTSEYCGRFFDVKYPKYSGSFLMQKDLLS